MCATIHAGNSHKNKPELDSIQTGSRARYFMHAA